MTTAKFDRCHAVTKVWEGGWSNHKKDPGGATMYGVTQAVYTQWRKSKGVVTRSVRNITMDEALEIYQSQYWNPVNGETLAVGVDLAVYDAAVNSGVSRGKRWLMSSLGASPAETVKRICAKRSGFVRGLATFKTFGRGWSSRIADIEAKGVAWALAAHATRNDPAPRTPHGDKLVTQAVAKVLDTEAGRAKKSADTNKVAAGGTASAGAAGGSTTATTVDPTQIPEWALWGAGFAIVAALVLLVYFIHRARLNRSRAKAYAAEARKAELYAA